MRIITSNLPETLYDKIAKEIMRSGFAGKSDFFRFLALTYFLENKVEDTQEVENRTLCDYETRMMDSLFKYLQNSKNISKTLHINS